MAAEKSGVLIEIYKDLAQPGVRQVGAALGTVLNLGGNILLPIRLLNKVAAEFERRNFEEIAARFSSITEEQIVDVAPEIGVPITEKLSHTDDATLRAMYIELLAKAATKSEVSAVHPSFINVVSSITPDEAILLRSLFGKRSLPLISIDFKSRIPDGGRMMPHDLVFVPPSDIIYPANMALYISNFVSLGIVEVRRDTWLTADGSYDEVINYATTTYGYGDEITLPGGEKRDVEYSKHILSVVDYGDSFIKACVSNKV